MKSVLCSILLILSSSAFATGVDPSTVGIQNDSFMGMKSCLIAIEGRVTCTNRGERSWNDCWRSGFALAEAQTKGDAVSVIEPCRLGGKIYKKSYEVSPDFLQVLEIPVIGCYLKVRDQFLCDMELSPLVCADYSRKIKIAKIYDDLLVVTPDADGHCRLD